MTSPKPDRICVIFNPTARGDKAQHFQAFLKSLPKDVVLRPTTGPGAAHGLASEAVREGFGRVVAAGGDGTVNEVLNGMEAVEGGWERSALGVLPLGTVNVFALELGIPLAVEQAWRHFLKSTVRVLDLPVAEWSEGGVVQRRVFAQLAGAGLDARAVAMVRWEEKKRYGRWAYVLAGFRALRSGLPPIRVKAVEGKEARGQLVLLGNGRKYGGHFKVFPEAQLDDGLLDVAVFHRASLFTLLRFMGGWLTGSVHRFGGVTLIKTRECVLEVESGGVTGEKAMEFELDGDNVGTLPLVVRMLPRRMRVVA